MMRDPATGADPSPAAWEAMVQRVLTAGRAAGTPVGIHTFSAADCAARVAEGFQFVAVGSELQFMTAAAQAAAVTLRLGAGDGGAGRGLPTY